MVPYIALLVVMVITGGILVLGAALMFFRGNRTYLNFIILMALIIPSSLLGATAMDMVLSMR